MVSLKPDHPLRRLFAGLTEQTFIDTLGLGDPPLIDYLSELLSRFIHMDDIFRLKSAGGKRLEEVVEMVIEAEALPAEGRTRREFHRHVGDFTLFVYYLPFVGEFTRVAGRILTGYRQAGIAFDRLSAAIAGVAERRSPRACQRRAKPKRPLKRPARPPTV